MQNLPQIHWHEGLFLRPHHLQTMQHHLLEQVAIERRLAWAYPYGVIEAQISADEIKNSCIRFERLHVVMEKSGLEVRVPETADLPSLDIKNAFASSTGSFTVYLGVPFWSAERSNAIDPERGDDLRTRKIYRVQSINRPDENTGENVQPLLVRRINARLLLEGDDRTDLDVIPLLRVVRATAEAMGAPTMDPDYVPPCLVLAGSPRLLWLVRELVSRICSSRDDLQGILRSTLNIESITGNQIRQMLKLKSLNRFSARLTQLVATRTTSPFTLYLELRDLLAELEALLPDKNAAKVEDYNHDQLLLVFEGLLRGIRDLLPVEGPKPYTLVPFERKGNILVAMIGPDNFSKTTDFFLQTKDGGDPTEVADLVMNINVFKVMPKSQATLGMPGVPLAEERPPPPDLPRPTGTQYFRLLRSRNQRMWGKIEEEKAIGIFWKGLETSTMKIALCITSAGSKS